MPSTLPQGSAIGVGLESTRGTAVSRTNWNDVFSCELAEAAAYERFPILNNAATGGGRLTSYLASKRVSGRVVIPLQYAGIGFWLKQALGSVVTAGSSPYTHTYSVGPTPPEYLTLEKIIGGTQRRELYTGICVTGWRLVVSRLQVARLELDVLGFDSDGFDSAGTPSFGATTLSRAVMARHFQNSASGIPAEVTWNGTNWTFQELIVACNMGLSDVGDVGSYYPTAVDQGAERVFTVQATMRHEGTKHEALRAAHLAKTSSDLTFSCSGDSANQSIAATCRNAEISQLPALPLSGTGRVLIRPTWTLHADSSDGEMDLVVTNTDSSHSAN